jgi:hypothetical protein
MLVTSIYAKLRAIARPIIVTTIEAGGWAYTCAIGINPVYTAFSFNTFTIFIATIGA